MTAPERRMLVSLVTGALALTLPLTTAALVPAEAVEARATIVSLPSDHRADPRATRVIGVTDADELALDDELDPGPSSGPGGMGASVQRIVSSSGQEVSTFPHGTIGGVAGDRIVAPWSYGLPPSEVLHRTVSATEWTRLAVPDGLTAVTYTRDGVLLRDDARVGSLSLLPWDGGAPRSISGPLAGTVYAGEEASVDESTALLSFSSDDGGGRVVVDTSRSRVGIVPSAGDCLTSHGAAWSINDGQVAWLGQPDPEGRRPLCSVAVSGDAQPGSVHVRPGVEFAELGNGNRYELVAVGDAVLVSRAWRHDGTWGDDPGQPLVEVGRDGSTRTLARWAHSVVPTAPGRVVAVTGDAPGQAEVVELDVTSQSTRTVLSVRPVEAWRSAVAVDEDRVVTIDDSGHLGAVRQRTVDFDRSTVSASSVLDTDARDEVVAGEGGTAWSKSGWQSRWSGHRSTSGSVTYSNATRVAGTDDRWAAYRGGLVVDSTTGGQRPPHSRSTPTALQAGVTYVPGATVPGAPATNVVATDLSSSTAAEIPAGCYVNDVQVAGSWMLVDCAVSYPQPGLRLLDLTGATAPRSFSPPGKPLLGNGFIVARQADGDLLWTRLVGVDLTGEWAVLAPAAVRPDDDDDVVAVSRGRSATVAWVSGSTARAARLPGVVPSAVPARLTGVGLPNAPSATAAGTHRAISVRWPQAPAGEQVRRYDVAATATRGLENRYGNAEAPGDATGAVVTGLSNGVPYDVTVTAWNLAGRATTTTLRATPVPAPSAPTDVRVSVDPATGTAQLTWAHSATPGEEAVQAFDVEAGPVGLRVPGGERNVSFVVPTGYEGPVTMRSVGAAQSSQDVVSNRISFPGAPPPDTVPPTVRLAPLGAVTMSRDVHLSVAASDDRSLRDAPVSIRWRQGGPGRPLGSWVEPDTWRSLQPGAVTVPRLPLGQTACFSARAVDGAGNASAWSAPTCTTVPMDDPALLARGSARKVSGSTYFLGAARSLSRTTASLRTSSRVSNSGWLLATTCPTCGKVRVTVGTRSYGTIDLASRTTRHRQLKRLPGPTSASGVITLSPTRNGRAVIIDGLVLPAR